MEMLHHKIYKMLVLGLLLFVLPATALHATKVSGNGRKDSLQHEQLDKAFTHSIKEYKS